MSVKHIGLSVLVGLLCGQGMVRAQAPPSVPGAADVLPLYTPNGSDAGSSYAPSGSLPEAPLASSPAAAPAGTTAGGVAVDEGSPPIPPPVLPPLGLPASPWLSYPHSPCCCGPVGGRCSGPLGYEVFVRSGLAFPVGGNLLDRFLKTGWDIEGGGRLLFFDSHQVNKAWTVSLSVSNIFARTGNDNQSFTLFRVPVKTTVQLPGSTTPLPVTVTVPQLTASVSSINLTFANVGFGREWWLLGSADPGQQNGLNWRVGVDGGGRWGSGMVQFNEITHHDDVVGGMFCALHTDLEYPWRCGILFGGIRYEYNFIWTSLIQDQNNGTYQSMNLLFQLGARF